MNRGNRGKEKYYNKNNLMEESSLESVHFSIGRVVGVAVGEAKGGIKKRVPFIELKKDYGVINDAHAGTEKQVSLAAIEDIEVMNNRFQLDAQTGSFAENITTQGIDLMSLSPYQDIKIGEVILRVICLGKSPKDMLHHTFSFKGHTLLPIKGVFCKVVKGGIIKPGYTIVLSRE